MQCVLDPSGEKFDLTSRRILAANSLALAQEMVAVLDDEPPTRPSTPPGDMEPYTPS
mgnify:FL=1